MITLYTEYLEKLDFAESIADLDAILMPLLNHYGIEHCIGTNMYGLPCLPDFKPMFGTWESKWVDHYIRNGYYREDAVPLYARGMGGQTMPFYWSDLLAEIDLTKTQFQIFSDAWDAELREGLVIPIEDPYNQELAMVSMAGRSFRKNEETKGVLWSIAIMTHRRARFLLMRDWEKKELTGELSQNGNSLLPNRIDRVRKPNIAKLTPIQVTLIAALADDKTPEDIATIRGVHARTIHRHLSGARGLLGVTTNTGLVSVAKQYRIIT